MAVKPKIEVILEPDRCVVRMAPDKALSKYWPDWVYGRGANWPAALRDLADTIDALKPTYKRGRIPHDVHAAGRLRRTV